jgi:(S)-sulfolactate dehydrogenase
MAMIVITEHLGQRYVAQLRSHFEVRYDPDLYAKRPELLNAVAVADALLVRNRTRVDAELVDVATKLRVIGRLGVGLDNIDLEACATAGVLVKPATGANAVSVAEYVMGATLLLLRPVFGMTPAIAAGRWPSAGDVLGREAFGKTLGLLGFGSIARLVAARASAFDMEVIAHDPFVPADDSAWVDVESVSFEDLLGRSDVLSIHTRLNDLTRKMIDAGALKQMKPTAVLINTSRGETIDEDALIAALQRGAIRAAALDVFATEPLSLNEASRFAHLDNVLLTPHLAGSAEEAVHRVAAMTVDAVLEVLRS